MKNNSELQKDVQDAIKWEPLLKAAEIGVTVQDGIVTLTGTVDGYYKKKEAEDAAKNVVGVKAVVEKIDVKYCCSLAESDDNEIAKEVVNALNRNGQIPNNKLKVKKDIESALKRNWSIDAKDIMVNASDHKVTLTGTVKSWYQKNEATQIAWKAPGVRIVDNELIVEYNY
jgi:osmotically-inducible protein OsmY